MGKALAIVPEGMNSDFQTLIERALSQMKMETRSWKPGDPADSVADARVLFGELPSGERKVPAAIAELWELADDAQVFLLCHDELVRPTVPLHEGRMLLLGQPITAERLESELREHTSAASRGSRPSRSFTNDSVDDSPFERREHLNPDHWVARLGSVDATPSDQIRSEELPSWIGAANEHGGAVAPRSAYLPLVGRDARDATIGIVHFDAQKQLSNGELESLAKHFETEHDNANSEKKLKKLIGDRAGVVRLSPVTNTWQFYWPSTTSRLFFASPSRLPRWWDLRGSLSQRKKSYREIPAYASDLVVAIAVTSSQSDDEIDSMIRIGHRAGAQTLVNSIENGLLGDDALVSALMMEVR